MNERIKELADKARFTDKIPYPSEDEVFEKFAELIVRECADMVEEHQPRYLTRRQAQEMADAIKEHFGVEE